MIVDFWIVGSTKALKFMSAAVNRRNYRTNRRNYRNFYILRMCGNFTINISVIVGSMMAAFTTILQQFISAPVIYCNWFCNNTLSPYYIIASLNTCE